MSHLTLSEYDRAPSGRNVAAVPVGRYKGRRVYRVPVFVRANSSRLCATVASGWTTVTAYSAADAANYIRDLINRPETEIVAIGPKGGEVHRYIGWHSYIGGAISGAVSTQRELI